MPVILEPAPSRLGAALERGLLAALCLTSALAAVVLHQRGVAPGGTAFALASAAIAGWAFMAAPRSRRRFGLLARALLAFACVPWLLGQPAVAVLLAACAGAGVVADLVWRERLDALGALGARTRRIWRPKAD
ncbi:hypothetical protein [Coralloluteibacterium thermophilus]|uniref:Uncharacterized protein n=1 Tax=Coralloluteibacterium thermophilum TaxID=2707049 RepID=A0ABV9NNI2_9GAMM